ncbi:MAG TPA: 2-phosphosulfolactate phosphatase [Ilumatobacteraceae bacterium]|nr:2-phosphosulfolactate phosphatase [Ilumatobacteraceae bacterium]
MTVARFLPRWEVADVEGAVVAVDVIRAFTTAAYAFAAGARHIFLVDSIDEALAAKAADPDVLAMGEDRGRRPPGFDLSNSPVEVANADLDGRVLVQRTSAGTGGVVAARSATRLWCASLVCASATARAVNRSDVGAPTYLITGQWPDGGASSGDDDLATAKLIERARVGAPLDAPAAAAFVAHSAEAIKTLRLGDGHVDPDDIIYATRVDAFDFAMEVTRADGGLRLDLTT